MPPEGPHFTPSQIRLTLILGFLVALLEGYDLQVISSAGPVLLSAMHLQPEQMGLFFSASLIGLAIGSIAGGAIADRTGRKPVLVGSLLIMGLFALLAACAPNFPMLIAMRVLGGIGLGGAMPTLIALISEIAGMQRASSRVTTMICGQPAGGIVSALVGRTLAERLGWQSLFIVGGTLTVLIVPALWRFLPETGADPAHRHGGHGAHHHPHVHPSAGGRARMGTVTALFGEKRAIATLMLWIIFILTLALLSITLSWTPLLATGKGLPKGVGFGAILAINLGGIVGGLVASRLIDRFGAAVPMLGLYAITAAALWGFAGANSAPHLLGAALAVGIGVLGSQFSLYGIAPRIYPHAGRGAGVGIAVAMGRIGSVLGPLAIGRLLGHGANADGAILAMVPAAVMAGLALLALALIAREALSAPARAGR